MKLVCVYGVLVLCVNYEACYISYDQWLLWCIALVCTKSEVKGDLLLIYPDVKKYLSTVIF